MRKAVPVFSLFCGISMLAVWGTLLATGQVVELQTSPLAAAFLLGAEFLTALSLILGGYGLLARKSWGLRMDLAALGWTFFGAQILSGFSLLLAARLAPRLGLVNTMVFSHLVSNVLLIGVALAPSAALAVTLLLARHLLSQMDVPTRQSFLMLAVQDHEREGAASLTNMSRTLAQSVSPALTGWVMASVSLAAPFFLGGGLKILYDLLLYATIRKVETR